MTGCDIKDGEKHVILLRGNEVTAHFYRSIFSTAGTGGRLVVLCHCHSNAICLPSLELKRRAQACLRGRALSASNKNQ